MEYLKIGQQVNIKRSDGRIHPVIITSKNPELNSITGEWTEGISVKGKEVSVSLVLALNTHLIVGAHPAQSTAKPATAMSVKQLPAQPLDAGTSITYRKPGAISPYQAELPRKNDFRAAAGKVVAKKVGPSASVRNLPRTPMTPTKNRTAATPRPQSTRNANSVVNQTTNRKEVCSNPSTTTPPRSGKRCSSVVREVERMKENREKRRAQQAEHRQEQNALRSKDPNNPNWEVALMVRQYRDELTMNPLRSLSPRGARVQQITVCVRKRPLSRREELAKNVDIISVPTQSSLIVHELRNKVDLTKFLEHHPFRFDYTFDDQCSNNLVYEYTARPLIRTMFEGGNATCFAYGQTGSGKTHTMGGEFYGKLQDFSTGIYALAAKDVFEELTARAYRGLNVKVTCSFFEIYGTKVFDLLAPGKQQLRVLEDGRQQVQVVGLTEVPVAEMEDVHRLIALGNKERISGQTSANAKSSRSHAVFQISLQKENWGVYGKCSFVDLAGNERGADTKSANRQTRIEGAEINKSLLALKECIRALSRQSSHLPFRGSKLTQVLRDSFIGGKKNKTCMIAMISPGLTSVEHTLNTLRYADRVKELVAKDDRAAENGSLAEESEMIDIADDSELDLEPGVNGNTNCSSFQTSENSSMQDNESQKLSSECESEIKDLLHGKYLDLDASSELIDTNSQEYSGSASSRSLSKHSSDSDASPFVKMLPRVDGQPIELSQVIEQHKVFNEFLDGFLRNFKALDTHSLDENPRLMRYLQVADQHFHELTSIANLTRDMLSNFIAQHINGMQRDTKSSSEQNASI